MRTPRSTESLRGVAVLAVALLAGCSAATDTGESTGPGASGTPPTRSVAVPPVRDLPPALTGPGRPGELPAGTYRYQLTHDEIVQRLGLGDTFADANAGIWTWTLSDGKWSYEIKLDAGEVPAGYAGLTCEGYHDVQGGRVDFTTVTVYSSGDCASKTWLADWQQTDQGLQMDVVTDGADLDFLFGSKEWQRIA